MLTRQIRRALQASHGDESGQMAIMMALLVIGILAITGFSYDTGVWYFDHRTAQNQAEAAALAAVIELPAKGAQTNAQAEALAVAAANDYLEKNGSATAVAEDYHQQNCPASDDRNHIMFQDISGDTYSDSVTVCVRRHSAGAFSKLSGISFVHISASAKARVGPVNGGNVMPWAIVPPDPDCPVPTPANPSPRNCRYDANGDGDRADPGDCDAAFAVCPWGLTADRLYGFKSGGGGNTGIIDICGNGASGYHDCLDGAAVSGVTGGTTITVGLQGGNLGTNTDNGLQDRAPAAAWDLPGANVCDVVSTPLAPSPATQSPGYDPDGKAAAAAKFVNPASNPQCAYRLVLVPILHSLPPNGGGSVQIQVLGVATFGVAKWNRTSNRDYFGTGSQECVDPGGGAPPANQTSCGMVWGYLFSGVMPPETILEQIGNTNNPFAPLLIALVD